VEATGKLRNEIAEVTSQNESIETRNNSLNMDRVLEDLTQVKNENKALTAKLKALKKDTA